MSVKHTASMQANKTIDQFPIECTILSCLRCKITNMEEMISLVMAPKCGPMSHFERGQCLSLEPKIVWD